MHKKGVGFGIIVAVVFFIVVIVVGANFIVQILKGNRGLAEIIGLSPEATMADADEAFNNEYYDEAMRIYRDFLELFPKDKNAFIAQFRIGECYLKMEEYQKALIEYKKTKENYELSPEWQQKVEAKIAEIEVEIRTERPIGSPGSI